MLFLSDFGMLENVDIFCIEWFYNGWKSYAFQALIF